MIRRNDRNGKLVKAVSLALVLSLLAGCGCAKKSDDTTGAAAEEAVQEVDWTGGPQQDDADTPGIYEAYGYYAGGTFFDGDESGAEALLDVRLVLEAGGNGTLTISKSEIPISWEGGSFWYRDMANAMDPMYSYISHKDEIIVTAADDAYRYYMHKEGSDACSGLKFAQAK